VKDFQRTKKADARKEKEERYLRGGVWEDWEELGPSRVPHSKKGSCREGGGRRHRPKEGMGGGRIEQEIHPGRYRGTFPSSIGKRSGGTEEISALKPYLSEWGGKN